MTRPVIWMDSAGYAEARASLSDWAVLVGPQDWAQRPWQDTLEGAEAAVVTARYCFDGELFARAPRLLIVARLGVGYDNVDLSAATAAGVCVTSTPGATTDSVAEHTVGLLLALSRHFNEAERLLRQGDWQARQRLVGTELRSKTLGVIGLGRIGSGVARICRVGLGMQVLAYDPYLNEATVRERCAEPVDALEDLIAQADAITLHVPATAETYHMINAATLARARRGAVLINTARGTVVDAEALAAALRAGRLAGAALDVFEPEPLPPGFTLLEAPNLLVTPHLAGSTFESQRRVGLEVAEDVHAFFQGRQPARLLNPGVWAHRRRGEM